MVSVEKVSFLAARLSHSEESPIKNPGRSMD